MNTKEHDISANIQYFYFRCCSTYLSYSLLILATYSNQLLFVFNLHMKVEAGVGMKAMLLFHVQTLPPQTTKPHPLMFAI